MNIVVVQSRSHVQLFATPWTAALQASLSLTISPTLPQAVTFLWRAAGSPDVEGDMVFTDVAESAYYYDAVLWAVAEGITSGTTATTFSPNATCTRAQIGAFLWRSVGSPEVESTDMIFADVADTAYYSEAVQWALEEGITAGTTATTFSPDAEKTCCNQNFAARFNIFQPLWRSMISQSSVTEPVSSP